MDWKDINMHQYRLELIKFLAVYIIDISWKNSQCLRYLIQIADI